MGSLDEVLLSGFLHDIGKGLGGDHSNVGADLAVSFLQRTGVWRRHRFGRGAGGPPSPAAPGNRLPEGHRRPGGRGRAWHGWSAIRTFFRVLALLSVADAIATGPDMWSNWKESLLRNLVSKDRGASRRHGFRPIR